MQKLEMDLEHFGDTMWTELITWTDEADEWLQEAEQALSADLEELHQDEEDTQPAVTESGTDTLPNEGV